MWSGPWRCGRTVCVSDLTVPAGPRPSGGSGRMRLWEDEAGGRQVLFREQRSGPEPGARGGAEAAPAQERLHLLPTQSSAHPSPPAPSHPHPTDPPGTAHAEGPSGGPGSPSFLGSGTGTERTLKAVLPGRPQSRATSPPVPGTRGVRCAPFQRSPPPHPLTPQPRDSRAVDGGQCHRLCYHLGERKPSWSPGAGERRLSSAELVGGPWTCRGRVPVAAFWGEVESFTRFRVGWGSMCASGLGSGGSGSGTCPPARTACLARSGKCSLGQRPAGSLSWCGGRGWGGSSQKETSEVSSSSDIAGGVPDSLQKVLGEPQSCGQGARGQKRSEPARTRSPGCQGLGS